jgi:uncharacterized protein (TIGR02996 family)
MDDEALLRAILEHPDDDAPRLVYADWLEEKDHPSAATVWAFSGLGRLLVNLATDSRATFRQCERYAESGRADLLAALSTVLEGCHRLIENPKFAREVSVAQRVLERLLALTPGRISVEAVLARRAAGGEDPVRDRDLASRLAGGQPADVLLDLFERHEAEGRHDELLACLVQELVLRDTRITDSAAVARFAARLRERGHPLAVLPLSLTGVELELRKWLPNYHPSGESRLVLTGPDAAADPGDDSCTPEGVPSLTEVAEPAASERIEAAVRGQGRQAEVRLFRAAVPVGGQDPSPRLLLSLGLDSLRGADPRAVRAEFAPASRAVGVLFSAASLDVASTCGLRGAYGRLATWQSVAGLVGAEAGEGVEAVAALAERCRWLYFAADTAWFEFMYWSLALAAVRPDGLSLAVLAATDSDCPRLAPGSRTNRLGLEGVEHFPDAERPAARRSTEEPRDD